MRLTQSIALRLSLVLLPLIAAWAVIFYFGMVNEINDEADDSLEDYSERIMLKVLAGEQLPGNGDGTNNSYSIVPVDEGYAAAHPRIKYYDADVYIPEKMETEPARILTTIFMDSDGIYYELKVATPTFEKEDLKKAILWYVVILYVILLATVEAVTLFVFHRSMKPLYALLEWLDSYRTGTKNTPVPNNTSIREFAKLNSAAQRAMDRSEQLFEQQKLFIGNASHELQTPIAVLTGRIELMLDNENLDESTMGELIEMRRTLDRMSRLNKTLLMLNKIDNNQFPESSDVDISALIRENTGIFSEIHEDRKCSISVPERFIVHMNESLASVLISNLIRNAYRYSGEGGEIIISMEGRTLSISNSGQQPLDAAHVFERFHHSSRKEGSNGLGLALAKAVADYYHFGISYNFRQNMHIFSVNFE